jgi:hypothetical protein
VRHEWVKSIRTVIQGLIALIPVLPILLPALGLPVTVGVGATVVSMAGVASRLMATPTGETILRRLNLHS